MSTVPLAPWLAHRPRRGATVVDTVVLHHSAQPDFAHLVETLRDEGHSYHYVIDEDGTVHKCVPYSAVAYHAGNSYGPREAARGISRQRDARQHFVELTSVNEYTISICLMRSDDYGGPCPKEQVWACQTLLQDLKTPLPKLTYLTTHAWVAPGQAQELTGLEIVSLAADTGMAVWAPEA
ncbi:MAG: N-acetylmuramoyl-L-alanine amidase [Fimbriimonas sp.]